MTKPKETSLGISAFLNFAEGPVKSERSRKEVCGVEVGVGTVLDKRIHMDW